jgi:hypothetical protein
MDDFVHKRETDYVTSEVCFEREKSKSIQICNVDQRVDKVEQLVADFVDEMRKDREHRVEIESKLFDGQKMMSNLLAEMCTQAKSTQVELSEHKTNHNKPLEDHEAKQWQSLTILVGIITVLIPVGMWLIDKIKH